MAFVNGRWLDDRERKERLRKQRKLAQELSKKARKKEANEVELDTLRKAHNEIKRLEAIERGDNDVAFFAYRYFSDEYNPDNAAGNIIRNESDGTPHETLEEIAPIHSDFYDVADQVTDTNPSGNYAIAAPRGHAKTQVFSVILTIHEIVYRKRKYALLISSTDSLSKKIVASISEQLKYNERLREDFGELLHVERLKNRKDADEAFITTSNALVEASSAGKALRGKTHLGHRPDLIILDDVSSSENEATDMRRRQLIEWFNTTVSPLGEKGTATLLVGTMVSATGLLRHLLDRRDFKSVFHSAIIQEPENQQLWQDYLHYYNTEPNDYVVNQWYEERKDDLEKGAIVAWPRRWTYRDLMHEKVNIGSKAFASEYLNDTLQDDEAVFHPDEYDYYRYVAGFDGDKLVYDERYIHVSDLDIFGAWDVALARSTRSAQNAFITVGRERETGRIFVLDVYATRQPPSKFMEEIIDRIRVYKHDKVVVEGIGAYSDFHRQLTELARVRGIYSTRIELITSHGTRSKEQRIEQLEPAFANRSLILNDRHTQLMDELRHYPHGLVDILDALSMAVENASKRKRSLQKKPSFL